MEKKCSLIIVFTMLLFGVSSRAQMSQFKALYLYNFAKNISWPEENQGKEFVITVIGDNEVASELDKISSSKKIGVRSVVVKKVATTTAVPKSQIIYLGESKVSQMHSLIGAQSKNNVLIVSGKNGQCANGAGISFVAANGKLNYEISSNNISNSGLICAQKLIKLGIEVF